MGVVESKVQNAQCEMARWQRLYHKHIASFFNRGLYWKGFATFGRARGGVVFLGEINGPDILDSKIAVCIGTKTKSVC